MQIKITKAGIYGQDGEIPIGTEITVAKEPTDWAGRYEVLSGGDEEGKTAILNADMGEAEIGDTPFSAKTGENLRQPDTSTSQTGGGQPTDTKAPAYEVKEKGAGWFVITKDGEPVTKSLRKSETDGFDAMSDEGKATFVEQNKPEA